MIKLRNTILFSEKSNRYKLHNHLSASFVADSTCKDSDFCRYRQVFCIKTLYSSLCPIASVQASIADGFGDVLGLDGLGTFQVGNGAGDLEDTAVGAGRE